MKKILLYETIQVNTNGKQILTNELVENYLFRFTE